MGRVHLMVQPEDGIQGSVRPMHDGDELIVAGTGGSNFTAAAAAAETNSKTVRFDNIAAKSANSVHASYGGDEEDLEFPGPITNPATPRNLRCVFAAAYDGGDLTVVGTDQFDEAVEEVFTAVANTTVVGTKVFKTVTSITKAAVGLDVAGVSVGTGDKIGIVSPILADNAGACFCDGVAEAVTLDATLNAFTPTTAPNGTKDFTLLVNTVSG